MQDKSMPSGHGADPSGSGLKRGSGWRRPEILLIVMAAAMPLSFFVWQALLNNFAVERAAFTGREIGILQSLREIPGFLAFTVIFALMFVREQKLALLSLVLLGGGVALTGFFPSVMGLYLTTVLMSVGFHYSETIQQSLALQWLPKSEAPRLLGRLISVRSFAALGAFAMVWLMLELAGADYRTIYVIGGGIAVAVAVFCLFAFPDFGANHEQHKKIVLKRRYWLFYALTFMAGARRQIFVVFAGFMMVEKFGYSAASLTLLMLVNYVFNVFFAQAIGGLIGRWGERRAMVFEYCGLIGVFTAYAFVQNATIAAGLYIIDHLFFALAIAIRSYFQKIADPADIAASSGVSFTINHIAAIVLPVVLGMVWMISPQAVFLTGAGLAVASLLLSLNVPRDPAPGREAVIGAAALPASDNAAAE